MGAMSGTKRKFWPEPSPIYYLPKYDPRVFKALWEQRRREGLSEAYRRAEERLREILRRRGRVYG